MKTLPVLKQKTFVSFIVTLCLSITLVNAQTTYETRQAGNWMSAATWINNQVPPTTILSGRKVIIRHWTFYNSPNQLYIYGTLEISGDTLRWQSGSGGSNVNIHAGGVLDIKNGGLIMPMSGNNGNLHN